MLGSEKALKMIIFEIERHLLTEKDGRKPFSVRILAPDFIPNAEIPIILQSKFTAKLFTSRSVRKPLLLSNVMKPLEWLFKILQK